MIDIDRIVAGISCRDVLSDLSDFIDGVLTDERVAALQAHLAGCDTCARFGGAVTSAVRALREADTPLVALPAGAAERLRSRLHGEAGRR